MRVTVPTAYEPKTPRIDQVAVPHHLVCVDLGQANDYTATTVLTPAGGPAPTYTVGHIERAPQNTRYTSIVDHIAADIVNPLSAPIPGRPPDPVRLPGAGIIKIAPAKPKVTLLVDYTGVGRPVLDMFLEAQHPEPGSQRQRLDEDCTIVPVTITGGDQIRATAYSLNIPKRELASVVQVVLQEKRLLIPEDDPMAEVMVGELVGFRAKIGASGHDTYGAAEDWRSGNPGNHDDLVLSLALGLWYGENAMTHSGG